MERIIAQFYDSKYNPKKASKITLTENEEKYQF